jgi:IS5 family transposase
VTPATGWGERAAAEAMIEDVPRGPRPTLAADKAYDTAAFVATLRAQGVVPHVAQNLSRRRSAVDRRTTRHGGYTLSQRARKRIEEAFGWIKTIGGLRKTRHRGRDKVRWAFTLTAAAYNLIRLPKLLGDVR